MTDAEADEFLAEAGLQGDKTIVADAYLKLVLGK